MADKTNKTAMFIDYQKQEDKIEFSFNRMDELDVKIFSIALDFLVENTSTDIDNSKSINERCKSLQSEFLSNHYTQNTGKSLIE